MANVTRIGSGLVCSLLLSSAGACGGKSSPASVAIPPPDPSKPVVSLSSGGFYCPSEYLSWSLTWRGLRGATTQMVVGEPGVISGQDAIVVRSSSKSSPLATMFREVREELTSEISLESGQPVSNIGDAWEDKKRELTEIQYDADAKGFVTKLSTNFMGGQSWHYQNESKVNDLHSFLAVFRQWQAEPGTRGQAYVQNGRSVFQVELAVVGPESVTSDATGKTAAIRLQGMSKRIFMDGKKVLDGNEFDFSIWRSDDSRFLPLRFEVETRLGTIRGELVEYRHAPDMKCVVIR